jgi:hypothetical protein
MIVSKLAHEAIIEAMVDKFNFELAQIQGILEAEVRTSPVITGVFPLIFFRRHQGVGTVQAKRFWHE